MLCILPATAFAAANDSAAPDSVSSAAVRTSGIDLQWVDKNVRPQDDFFRYMSGKWLDSTSIPADRARYGAFDQLRDLSEKQSFDIINDLAHNNSLAAGSNQKKIADLFNSFMDEARADTLDIKPLQSEFAYIDSLSKKSELPAMMAKLAKWVFRFRCKAV